MTMSAPNYMFYAPYVKDTDYWREALEPVSVRFASGFRSLRRCHLLIGETEKAKIVADSSDLLRELCSYRKYLCLDAGSREPY
jgi:hypothetical protein